MDHLEYMFLGFAVFWAALFAYTVWLQARLRAVSRELERLEERLADRDGEGEGAQLPRRAEPPTTTVTTPTPTPQRTTE
jgi:CcmD family protein